MLNVKQTKYSKELVFLIIAVLILIVFVASVSLILGFLISRLNMVFNPNVIQPTTVVQFDIDGFKKLELTR